MNMSRRQLPALVSDWLEAQLALRAERFMADLTRNRWNAGRRGLELSKIFDWSLSNADGEGR